MSTITRPVTAEALYEMGDIGRCELINGEIVHMAPANAEHGNVAIKVAVRIANFLDDKDLGELFAAETGFIIARDPDTVRAPDVGFIKTDRLPKKLPKGFFDGAPDLAVEVVSPSESATDVAEKVDQWLSAGTKSVWVIYPKTRSAHIHRDGETRRYHGEDEITDEPLLPGFRMKLASIFP